MRNDRIAAEPDLPQPSQQDHKLAVLGLWKERHFLRAAMADQCPGDFRHLHSLMLLHFAPSNLQCSVKMRKGWRTNGDSDQPPGDGKKFLARYAKYGGCTKKHFSLEESTFSNAKLFLLSVALEKVDFSKKTPSSKKNKDLFFTYAFSVGSGRPKTASPPLGKCVREKTSYLFFSKK